MKKILLSILNKVFAIFNTEIRFNEGCIEASQVDFIQTDLFTISKGIDEYILYIYLYVKDSSGGYIEYKVEKSIEYSVLNLPYINFIGKNCIRTLKSFKSLDTFKMSSPEIILSAIDKTIELSIIALATGDKRITPFRDSVTNQMATLFNGLDKWANRTYEGRKIPFSILIDCDKINYNLEIFDKLNDFVKDDASALLTDGISSYFELGENISYKVVDYYDAEKIDSETPFVPYRFSSFGYLCSGQMLGIILTVQGDILIIKKRKLIFAKRNGEWHSYDYDAFNQILFNDMPEIASADSNLRTDKIKMIYLTCLDVAFARTGGCLSICEMGEMESLKENINKNDIHRPFRQVISKDYRHKRYFLEDVVIDSKKFDNLNRKARQELLGIDGATVILTDGRFLTTGAIMDNSSSFQNTDNHGGARTKIAMKLSEFGVAIKISADGYIECYKKRKHIL